MSKPRQEIVFIDHIAETFNTFVNKNRYQKTSTKNAIKRFAEIALIKLKPFEKPVVLEWVPVIGRFKNHKRKKRVYDVLNYSHQYKYSEDQLTQLKKIVDDGNGYVKKHICHTPLDKPDFEGRGIMLIITEVEDNDIQEIEDFKDEKFESWRKNNGK